jgi:hypothetical protein
MVIPRTSYYTEFIEETRKIIREIDQSASAAGIVREIEAHRSGQEEKEERMELDPVGDMVHNALTEALDGTPIHELEEMDSMSMEAKIIASREEEDPRVSELTPGEISRIVNNALRGLPESLVLESGSEISDTMFEVAYAVMNQITGD